MAENTPIIQILKRWPNRQAVHEDARLADPGLDMVAVHRWFQRGSIPSKYDAALLDGAEKRGIGLHPMEIVKARSGHTDRSGHPSPTRQGRLSKRAGGVA